MLRVGVGLALEGLPDVVEAVEGVSVVVAFLLLFFFFFLIVIVSCSGAVTGSSGGGGGEVGFADVVLCVCMCVLGQ